ncbi:unnamed protein product [Peronospora destructor]|uniref:Casein kinase I n=1 Tax=Peronospora destructor TaxID=86335 RepID=A0AAV0TI94_9STRA|nr:unnamed protein product [Peronospora destructor]
MMRAASSPMEPLNKNILLAGEVIAEKWKIGEKIGEGTFSQIYSAYSIESHDKVAVKVEAPSSLKPVLEWESLILKSLQDCSYVCRYYYHGKHGDSTVLVMELLGDSMSMLRMSPDSIHGVPLAKSVSVGLEMLDCIEAFHRHGYVHRDIKASNFALNALSDRNPLRQQRYYIIDFGLSRQHTGEDRQVLPARSVAEFRGTSMYASLSSHRRQELGPKDDLWSWFYLVMDFMRGELPWAADAQLKNRQTVLRLKEHYTEMNPSLLVEGLPGAMQLLEMMDYLQSLKYEDFPDYAKIRKQLGAAGGSSLVADNSDSGDEESSADKKKNQAVAAVSLIDWCATKSERERALAWVDKAEELKHSDEASNALLKIAKRYKTFFDCDGLLFDEQVRIQSAVYRIEKKSRARSSFFLAPPPIQSFMKRRQSEQRMRSDALRKRREKDFQVRQSLEIKNEEQIALAASIQASSEVVNGITSGDGASEVQNGAKSGSLRPLKSESSMEFSDNEDVGKRRNGYSAGDGATISASQPQSPLVEPQDLTAEQSPDHLPLQGFSLQHSFVFGHRPPPLPPFTGPYPAKHGIPPPPVGFQANGVPMSHPTPPPPHSTIPAHQYASEPDQRYGAPVEAREGNLMGHQWPQKSPREKNVYPSVRQHMSETREDRGYGFPRIKQSLRDPVHDQRYDGPMETREDRGYSSYQPSRKSPLNCDRRYDVRTESREDRGYTSYHRSPRETNVPTLGSHYVDPTEDRGYGAQLPPKPQNLPRRNHEQYQSGSLRGHIQEKERYYEGKRSRQRSRSRSSSRSFSSRSASTSPPAKRYRQRPADLSYLESLHRHSSHSTSRHRSRSKEYPTEYLEGHPKEYAKGYPKEYTKSYSKGFAKDYAYAKDYPKEYAKEYSKEYVIDYPKKYLSKDSLKEHMKDYRRSPSPDCRQSHSRNPHYWRSPSQDRHWSHSRDYGREDESRGVNIRYKPAPTPEKHRRSSRWEPRP